MTERAAITYDVRRALGAAEGGRRWLRACCARRRRRSSSAAACVFRAKNRPPPPARYVTTTPSTGDVAEKVQATGAVQPLLQVNVGSQVNGRVAKVYVDFNSVVKKGDVLAEIDPIQYGAQVTPGSGAGRSRKGAGREREGERRDGEGRFDRTQRLFQQNLASKGELDTAARPVEVAKAQVTAAEAQIGAIQAQLRSRRPTWAGRRSTRPSTASSSRAPSIPAPRSSRASRRPSSSSSRRTSARCACIADVDEADVGKLKEGMEAEAVVDAFPGESFKGKVEQVRYSPNNVQGVVTYSAVVEVENPEEKLRPGHDGDGHDQDAAK